jgi:hypothetical protein
MNILGIAGNPIDDLANLPVRKGKRRMIVGPLLSGACIFALALTIFLAHSQKGIKQRGDLSREILKEDHRFLSDLFEKASYDDRTRRESSLAPIQNVDNVVRSESHPKTVLRATLVVNTEIVRRAQLVVHGKPVARFISAR